MAEDAQSTTDLAEPEDKLPRNAVAELYTSAPSELLSAIREIEEEVVKANPVGDWPDVPYHFGMGRIKAYEEWLASLSKEAREREIAGRRARYEARYDNIAGQMRTKLRNKGVDLEPHQEIVREGDAGSADEVRQSLEWTATPGTTAPDPRQVADDRERDISERIARILGQEMPDRPLSRSRTSPDEPTPGGRRGRGR